jgi:hypothetical protein
MRWPPAGASDWSDAAVDAGREWSAWVEDRWGSAPGVLAEEWSVARERADLPLEDLATMADSQVPWGVDALGGTISEAAWRSKPSWYLVATDDRMIPPSAQREMSGRAGSTVEDAAASHSI